MQPLHYFEGMVSEKICLMDLPHYAMARLFDMGMSGVEVNVPLAIFEVAIDAGGRRPLELAADEEARRLAVVALHPVLREDLLAVLAPIALREEVLPQSGSFNLNVVPTTPLKHIFQLMAEQQATVFSITSPDQDGDLMLLVFARTAFTISEFRREIVRMLSDSPAQKEHDRN